MTWRRGLAVAAIAVELLLPGCGEGTGDWDLAAPLFEPDRLLEVEIALDPSDWDALRLQTRTWEELFERPDCLGSPFPSPFSYFPASVTIDGELLDGVAVRKKGFIGSLDPDKPSLKISLDEIDPDRAHLGLEKLTLNNAIQDRSYVNQCIAYDLFARAGMPASRCNFARVTVNGEDLGVYVHVESIEDELIEHHFGSSRGNLYEGTLSDFRPEWSGTFEKKNNRAAADWSDLEAVIAAAQAGDDELVSSLEAIIDLDQFVSFWALEGLIRHWDGHAGNSNNFWIYRDGNVFQVLPWGTDQVLVDRNPVQGDDAPTSVQATSVLPWRLLQLAEGRERYETALRALLDQVWDEPRLLAEIDRIEALISPHVLTEGFGEALADRRAFIGDRRAAILAELEGGLPAWTYPLRDPICR